MSSLNFPLSSSSITSVNCCSNSRLAVNEDDLMWFRNYGKLSCIGKLVSWTFLFQKPQ